MKIRQILFLVLLSASPGVAQTDEALLDTLQHSAFTFFWQQANPANGLIKDRTALGASCSIASVGFGLSAICIGSDHGWVTRAVAADRVRTTLKTFWTGPQGGSASGTIGNFGLFYHFLDMTTAVRSWDSELSTIDTALLLAGIVDARQYFDGADSIETAIRAYADSIYRRMNWNLMRNYNPGILMGWKPGTGFSGYGQWVGYNEATIMYILALGSPTYPVDYYAWQAWTQGYLKGTFYGYSYVFFPPLFGHQYSHCWIDFRSINEHYMENQGLTYFENSQRATLAQRAYSIANPGGHKGYSDSLWGITASDAPNGYSARGAPPPQADDGTIVPTAAISSIPFAPSECLTVARTMWNQYRAQLWTPYGFRDAFNLDLNWWGPDIIGIDQGPIIIMIENYRTGRVWERFMRDPDVQRGLQRAGFQPVTAVKGVLPFTPSEYLLAQNFPNPFNPVTHFRFQVPTGGGGLVRLAVYDLLGREVALVVNEHLLPGEYDRAWDAGSAPSGAYSYRLSTSAGSVTKKLILLR